MLSVNVSSSEMPSLGPALPAEPSHLTETVLRGHTWCDCICDSLNGICNSLNVVTHRRGKFS